MLRLFASPAYRPPVLPAIALEMVQLSQRPHITFDEVAALLERDPVLAAKVLSIAQSALYAPRCPVLSLKQASVRLGMKALRSLVVEAALKLRVFSAPGYDATMERLARHSTASAHLMRMLCRETQIDAEYAFLCGLLHDVGIAACLLALADDVRGGVVPFEALRSVLDLVHEDASGLVTRLWGLPAEIQRIAATHHQLEVGGTPHPVNAALIVAEQLASELDAGMSCAEERGLDANSPELFAAACRSLHLDEDRLKAARAEAVKIVEAISCPTRDN